MLFSALSLACLLGGMAFVTASPKPQEDGSGCSFPEVIFSTLEDDFSISVLTTSSDDQSYPPIPERFSLLLSPRTPTASQESTPIISLSKIAQPKFKLINETLFTVDGNFPAQLLPTIAIFPPVAQGFVFGGSDNEGSAVFGAVYECNAKGDVFLKLITPSVGTGFGVEEAAEGEAVIIKPQNFQGDVVDVNLRIDSMKRIEPTE